MSQTENVQENSEERIRKIYAKDLKIGESVHTVFRAARKEKLNSRGGKSFLSLTLVDRTGEVDARVFENVDAADQAFAADDYLLLKGKVGQFHGKTQIVIDRLERLDPGPIDAKDFTYVAPPAPPAREKKHDDHAHEERAPKLHLSKRLSRLLENPQVAQALDQLAAQLEKAIEAQVHSKSGQPAPVHEKRERKPRGPRVEHKPKPEGEAAPKPEPKRDPTLPEGLAFKPFNALVGEGEAKPEPKSDNG